MGMRWWTSTATMTTRTTTRATTSMRSMATADRRMPLTAMNPEPTSPTA